MIRSLATGSLALWVALSPAARAGCAVTPLATLAVESVSNFMTLAAAIDGQPVSLMMDTGADTELIVPEAAARLELPIDPARVTGIIGTGGPAGVSPHVLVRRLTLGKLAAGPISVPIGALPALPRIVPPVAGLLGADLLSQFDLDLDLPQKQLTLYAVADTPEPGAGCADAVLPPWTGRFDTVSLQQSGSRLIAHARIDGHPASALIDTGARSIIVGNAAASRFGAGPDRLAAEAGGITGGVDMREVSFHWHRFASLQLGSETMRDPVLTVSALTEQTDMLLGEPYFATRRVWLSYATGRMFVQPSGKAAPSSR